jgi:hypothetical protein
MEVNVTDALEQVRRIVRSKALGSSETLGRLLEYLARKSVSGEADQLKEYTIGIEAFGKPESYDPQHDSIVRLQVSRLRQKIAEYYQAEGQADRVLVDLPKGGFKVVFQPRVVQSAAAATARARRWRLAALLLGVALAAVSAAAIASFRARAVGEAKTWSPELEAFWAPILRSDRPLLICIGTPLFARLPGSRYFRDGQLNDWSEVEGSELVAGVKKALRTGDAIPWTNFTGVGEATGAFHLASLLARRRADLLLTTSSRLSWDMLSSHNVIFVGPPKFNRQLKDLLAEADLVVELDGIHNLRPGAGEPAVFPDYWAPSKLDGEIYGLISRLPGLQGRGFIFVFAGNTGPETEAAVQSVTDRQQAAALAKKIRLPSGDLPRYFQVLIRVQFKNLVPVKTSYVLHRIPKPAEQTSAER